MSYDQQLETLDRLRDELMRKVEGLDPERFNRSPKEGAWSPAQIVAHVISAESRSLAYLRKRTQDPTGIPKSGFVAACKSGMLKLVMRSRFKVKAPPGAGEVPDRAELAELAEEWDRVRSGWREFVAGFPAELSGRAVYKHPVAGRLSLEQALGFLAEHLERHMGQLDRTLRAVA